MSQDQQGLLAAAAAGGANLSLQEKQDEGTHLRRIREIVPPGKMAERARNGCVSISNKEIDLIFERFHDAETIKVALSLLPQIGPPNRKDEGNEDELSDHGSTNIDFADENNSAKDVCNDFELSDHESSPKNDTGSNSPKKKKQKTDLFRRKARASDKEASCGSAGKKAKDDAAVKKVQGAVVAGKKQPVTKPPKEQPVTKPPKEDTVEEENDEKDGIVEKVLGIFVVDEVIMFHIKWKGYPLKYGNGKDYMEPIEIMETHMGENHLIGKLVVSIHIILLWSSLLFLV